MSPSSEADHFLEHLVFEIAKGVAGKTGESFFRSLVEQLARALNADLALAGALQPDGERISILASYGTAGPASVAQYDLAGSPCANVVRQQVCSYPSDVQRLFPEDHMLVELDAQGYAGSPMIDSTGRCIGLICVISQRPLAGPKLAEELLTIFAARAATELERQNYEAALTHGEQRFRTFVEHATEGVLWFKLEQPVSLDLPEDEQIDRYYRYAYVADCNDQAARLFAFPNAEALIGARLDVISPRADPVQIERMRAGIRSSWDSSQLERIFQGRRLLLTRNGVVEDGKLQSVWVTARDITPLKEAEAEVLRLNDEL
jgi:PAS domain-containing protein